MPLYGALPDIGLPALLRLLLESACSGRLTLQQGAREGSLLLERGRLVGAAFGPWQGLNAVDALILILAHPAADARFSFEEGPYLPAPEGLGFPPDLSPQALLARVERVAARREEVAPLVAARWATSQETQAPTQAPDASGRETLHLDGADLSALLALSGGARYLEQIAAGRDLLETAGALARLRAWGLVRVVEPPPLLVPHVPPAPPDSPASPAVPAAPPSPVRPAPLTAVTPPMPAPQPRWRPRAQLALPLVACLCVAAAGTAAAAFVLAGPSPRPVPLVASPAPIPTMAPARPFPTTASPSAPARVEVTSRAAAWGPPPKSSERSERLRAGSSLASDPGRGGDGAPDPAGATLATILAAENALRRGSIRAVAAYSEGAEAIADLRFDLGEPPPAAPAPSPESPRLRLLTTYRGPAESRTFERVVIGARAWDRMGTEPWRAGPAGEGVRAQVEALLPGASRAARPTLGRDGEGPYLQWQDVADGASVTLRLDPAGGPPRGMRRVLPPDGAVLSVTYGDWNAPVTITPPA